MHDDWVDPAGDDDGVHEVRHELRPFGNSARDNGSGGSGEAKLEEPEEVHTRRPCTVYTLVQSGRLSPATGNPHHDFTYFRMVWIRGGEMYLCALRCYRRT